MENRVRLRVLGITYSQVQQGAYALVLAEEGGARRIPIIIGTAEAQAIAIRMEHLVPPRPLTHDLFNSFAQAFGVRLLEVYIHRLEDGVFSSELLFEQEGRQVRIDARTSDAVAIAMRTNSPLYTTEEILQKAGIVFDENDLEDDEVDDDDTDLSDSISGFEREPGSEAVTLEKLEIRLQKAIAEEDYEVAAEIQQEINRYK